jgi:hypothetical protein
MEEFEGNTDELIQQMEQDELVGATKMKPRDFAKLRGVAPQLVYYHIRNGHIDTEQCLCGATVIDVEKANEFWDKKEQKKRG